MKTRRDLNLVALSILTWGMGEGLFGIFQPLYLQEMGADPIIIGVILGINGIGMTVAQIPAGYLADRIGRRPLMWATWILGVVSTAIMAFSRNLTFFIVGLVLYGLTSAVLSPMNSYIVSARGDWSVGKAISFVSAMYNTGAILGPLAGGLIAQSFGLRAIYMVALGIFVVSTIIILFIRPQPVEKFAEHEKSVSLLKNPRFMMSMGMILVIMFAVYLPMPFASNFLQNERSLSLTTIGQLGAIGNVGNVILALTLGHLPVMGVFIISQVAMMLFTLLLWQGNGMLWYGIAYFFMGGYRLARAMTVAMVRPLVHNAQVGLAFGITEATNNFSWIVAPLLAGYIYSKNPMAI
ncbi:MAG: MFS transporter, partial [Anaerolineaceae bacterium]|nr:MFS transporter [Anaerolineaceae bacterium]